MYGYANIASYKELFKVLVSMQKLCAVKLEKKTHIQTYATPHVSLSFHLHKNDVSQEVNDDMSFTI